MNTYRNSSVVPVDSWCLDLHRQRASIPANTWYRRLYLRFHNSATEPAGSLLVVGVAIGILATLFTTGCSGSGLNNPVDPPKAREALKTALESWKKGDAPKSLQASPTPMTVQDLDWMGGKKLVDYQILSDGESLDANLSIPVKLTLESDPAKKKPLEKKVYYLVSTTPATTVFRDMFKP